MEIESARARYVRYKPGTSCLVAYDVLTADGPVSVYARCHAEDRLEKILNTKRRLEVAGPLGIGMWADTQASIAIFEFPNDYEIRSLRKLFEPDKLRLRIRRMLPAHKHLRSAIPQVLRYKPERRFVGKMEAQEGPAAVLRLYPQHCFAEMREKAWAFKSTGAMHVPRIVGDSERYNSIAHEWVDGYTPTCSQLADDEQLLQRIVAALGTLHKQRPRLGTMYSASDYCRAVQGSCETLAALDSAFGQRALTQADAVRSIILDCPWRPHAVHGDFTADQVLVQPDRITLLDFDRAGYGDPAMDIGAFAAGQIARALAHEEPLADAFALANNFAAAYARQSGTLNPVSVRACTAGALLMLAPEPFRHRAERWPEQTAAVLECVDRSLSREVIDA